MKDKDIVENEQVLRKWAYDRALKMHPKASFERLSMTADKIINYITKKEHEQ